MKKYLLYTHLLLSTLICAVPKTKEEKKIDQHNRYLKRKEIKKTLPKNILRIDYQYNSHPLLADHYHAMTETQEYKDLQVTRSQSRSLEKFKELKPEYKKIQENSSFYQKIYYQSSKDKHKALRDTNEYKTYLKLTRQLKKHLDSLIDKTIDEIIILNQNDLHDLQAA
jgi:hypothetical protein